MAKKRFNDHPFPYHAEIELEISKLTNLGVGLGRITLPNAECGVRSAELKRPATSAAAVSSAAPETQNSKLETAALPAAAGRWVVMVPFALPGELVRVRIYSNHKNYSEADLIAVLRPSPHRIAPRCPLFGDCGGCQYQNLTYAEQLRWKQQHVAEALQYMARIEFPVNAVHASPQEFGYRSKLTPHFELPREPRYAAESPNANSQTPKGSDVGPALAQAGTPPVAGSGASKLAPYTQACESASDPAPEPRNSKPGIAAASSDYSAFRLQPSAFPIGFLKAASRFALVDVPQCPIATDAINAALPALRAGVRAKAAAGGYQRGATVLLRHSLEGVTSDYEATITEEIPFETAGGTPSAASAATLATAPALSSGAIENRQSAIENPSTAPSANPQSAIRTPQSIKLRFLARDFFQNNPFILPSFTGYVREQAAASGARFLVDAYCGSGLFALTAARRFERVAGIEISASSVRWAQENAAANGIANATFRAGDASAIFAGLDFPAADTAVVIDPPRRGCDEAFLAQLVAYGPRTIVYVSCDPATQMRDLATLIPAGYTLAAVQPFDLFPQTRHLECVITLQKG